MKEMLEAARAAKGEVAGLTTEQKNAALNAMADALIAGQAEILDANALDMASAKEHISPVMLDRLKLTKERIAGMAQGIREVTALPDPVGRVRSKIGGGYGECGESGAGHIPGKRRCADDRKRLH